MALSALVMWELSKRLRPGARIAALGYPDIVAPHKDLLAILGERFESLVYREDSAEIEKWHGAQQRVPTAESFFALQDCKLDVYDVVAHRGTEKIADLNVPWGNESVADLDGDLSYDFVIDVGTAEHVFNIGTAFVNMAKLLRKGGVILHENPWNWANHGFYGIQPTLYSDFYGQPGFKLHECWLCPRGADPIKDVPRRKRFAYNGPEANMIAIAERTEVLPVIFPVQGKYKSMIPQAAAGLSGEHQKGVAHG